MEDRRETSSAENGEGKGEVRYCYVPWQENTGEHKAG